MIAPDMARLTHILHDANFHITIETAGTVYAPVACDLMSISPKLSNSVPHEREEGRWAAQHDRLRYRPEVLKRLTSEYAYQLKFVVMSPGDLDEINEIRDTLRAERERIILMPEGTSPEVLRDRGLWLAEVCKTHGYRYSPRLHIDLWGNRRGI
jgi:7-carboxy-7-deazaguanine synthase